MLALVLVPLNAFFVLFMPWAMGRVARDWLTQTFDESYEGSLEVTDDCPGWSKAVVVKLPAA